MNPCICTSNFKMFFISLFLCLVFFPLCVPFFLAGVIIEIQNFSELNHYLEPSNSRSFGSKPLNSEFSQNPILFSPSSAVTQASFSAPPSSSSSSLSPSSLSPLPLLVVLDIDDTLLIPAQMLGCDVWFRERLQKHQQAGLSMQAALDNALGEWEAVRHLTDIIIVEEGIVEAIRSFQDKKIPVMGLTTQGLGLSSRTCIQLESLGIDLQKSAPSQEEIFFKNPEGVLYRQGLLFTAGTHKGEALLKFLQFAGYYPEHVIFMNDKEKHLKEMESSFIAKKIPFTGLRYGYSDWRVDNYSKEIADIQWRSSSFEHILSDNEAEKILILKKAHSESSQEHYTECDSNFGF